MVPKWPCGSISLAGITRQVQAVGGTAVDPASHPLSPVSPSSRETSDSLVRGLLRSHRPGRTAHSRDCHRRPSNAVRAASQQVSASHTPAMPSR